ncbi:MAG: hypothetical protein QOH88_3039 [Verrucomicrobiota bacterium]|jgi:uncharacterized protein (TIGR02598 family)
MNPFRRRQGTPAFSLVEVVLAIGIVAFSILVTFGLLAVGHDTNKKSREDVFAAQIAANEFERLRSLSSTTFSTTYPTRYYDSNLSDQGTTQTATSVYEFRIAFVTTPPTGTADFVLNAEVRYPVGAAAAAQTVVRFTTLMNTP